MNITGQLVERKSKGEARKNIYNFKTNHMIIINGSVYRKLLHNGYIY